MFRAVLFILLLIPGILHAQKDDTSRSAYPSQEFPGLPIAVDYWVEEERLRTHFLDKDSVIRKTIVYRYDERYFELEYFGKATKKTYYDKYGEPDRGQVDSAGKRLFRFELLKGRPFGIKPHQYRYFPIDTTSWISPDPRRKFYYGLPYSRQECIDQYEHLRRSFELKAGDVVADVGAANGFIDGAMSVMCDSITFYIQDIDSSTLSRAAFDTVVNYFSRIRGTAQTNRFFRVIGGEKESRLPDGMFDKIYMINTFHEFKYPDEMVKDLVRKLKPGGAIYVEDVYSREDKVRRVSGCDMKALSVEELVTIMEAHVLHLTWMQAPQNSRPNILKFERDAGKSLDYDRLIQEIQPGLTLLDGLFHSPFALDPEADINDYITRLTPWISKIEARFGDLEYYIMEIVKEREMEGDTEAAGAVLRILLALYPNSSDAFLIHGEYLLEQGQFRPALTAFREALKKDSTNQDAADNIRELESMNLDSAMISFRDLKYRDSLNSMKTKWPYLGPTIPPYLALAGGLEGFRSGRFSAGVALNLANATMDPGTGGMVGFVCTYKRDLREPRIYSYDIELGIYSPITLGMGYNRNYAGDYVLGGFKSFIGISIYNIQLTYAYNFYNGKKDTLQAFRHNLFTFRYILPVLRLSSN